METVIYDAALAGSQCTWDKDLWGIAFVDMPGDMGSCGLTGPQARQFLLSAPILDLPPLLESNGRAHLPCMVFKGRELSPLLIGQELKILQRFSIA